MQTSEHRILTESLDDAFRFLRGAGVVVAVVILFSGVRFVRPNEVALVLRFGRLTGATPADQVHGPGILFAWPYLIDHVIRVPVKQVNELEVSDFSGDPLPGFKADADNGASAATSTSDSLDPRRVGYCVTGDHNIVHATVLVKYLINDPVEYALYTGDPAKTIRDLVCAALTQAIGALPVDSVLAEGKRALAAAVVKRAQQRLDEVKVGVVIAALEFRALVPPLAVEPDFKDVVSAYVEKQTKVAEARTYREQEVPKAQADRDRLISDARAFAAGRLAKARGDVATFKDVVAQYHANPAVVRERLYREATESILSAVGSRALLPFQSKGTRLMLPVERAPKSGPAAGAAGSGAPRAQPAEPDEQPAEPESGEKPGGSTPGPPNSNNSSTGH
jgi:membrane protease subunit HflK